MYVCMYAYACTRLSGSINFSLSLSLWQVTLLSTHILTFDNLCQVAFVANVYLTCIYCVPKKGRTYLGFWHFTTCFRWPWWPAACIYRVSNVYFGTDFWQCVSGGLRRQPRHCRGRAGHIRLPRPPPRNLLREEHPQLQAHGTAASCPACIPPKGLKCHMSPSLGFSVYQLQVLGTAASCPACIPPKGLKCHLSPSLGFSV